jgi:hypothetical protein
MLRYPLAGPHYPHFLEPASGWGDADNPIGRGGVLGIELGNNSVVEVGKIFTFSFSLLNSDVEQPAKDITVTWTGNQGFIARIMILDYSKLPLSGSTAGDAKPLQVQARIHREINPAKFHLPFG